MSEEYIFTADRTQWRSLIYYFFSSSFIRVFYFSSFPYAIRYLHNPLPESRNLNLIAFGLIFCLVVGVLYLVDWWSGRVIISGTVLKFRSWLHWRTINLNHLQQIELTQNAQGETVSVVLNRGKQEIDVDLCYLQDIKMLTELVTPHVTSPTVKPLSNNSLYVYLGVSLLLFGLSFLYALDIALLLFMGALIVWVSYKIFHLPLEGQAGGLFLGVIAGLCGVYALFQHGPAGHPCGYIRQAFQPTHCVRSWAEYDLAGFTSDNQQILVSYKGQFQMEPMKTLFPQFQRSYFSAVDLNLHTATFNGLPLYYLNMAHSQWLQDEFVLEYLQQGEWVVRDSQLYSPQTVDPLPLPPAELAAFAHHAQLLALLSEENFLIYQLPEVELVAEIPLPVGFTNLDPKQGCLAFAPEQPWLMYYQPEVGLLMIDVTTQETVQQFTTSGKSKFCFLAFAPEQNELVTLEGDVLRWRTVGQAEPGRELQLFTTPSRLALSPNGRWLALQDGQGVYLLDLH